MMEADHIDRFGRVDGIVLRSSEDPRPGPKEILMRVRASSLNYRDLMVLEGSGRGPKKLGVVPLSDGAGEVTAVGDGVTRVKLGDRVIGTFHPRSFGGPLSADYLTDQLGANLDDMLAEYAVLSEEALGPHTGPSILRGSRDIAVRCSDRLGGADQTPSSDRRRHGLDAGFRRRFGLCTAICPGLTPE
jgi:NADPH:quinone reductase-like Zn-dependent oxidoreductase